MQTWLAISAVLLIAPSIALLVWLHRLGTRLKNLSLDGLEAEYQPANIRDFPGYDSTGLQQRTAEFTALGFVFAGDVRPFRLNAKDSVSGFCRVLFHPDARCSATIMEVFVSGKQQRPLRSVVASDFEHGWGIGTVDYSPLAASRIFRHPRILGHYFPGVNPAGLFSRHIRLRDQFAAERRLQILRPTTLEAHVADLCRQTEERREIVRKKSPLTCACEYLAAKYRPSPHSLPPGMDRE